MFLQLEYFVYYRTGRTGASVTSQHVFPFQNIHPILMGITGKAALALVKNVCHSIPFM